MSINRLCRIAIGEKGDSGDAGSQEDGGGEGKERDTYKKRFQQASEANEPQTATP